MSTTESVFTNVHAYLKTFYLMVDAELDTDGLVMWFTVAYVSK